MGLATAPVGKAKFVEVTRVTVDQPRSDQPRAKRLPDGSMDGPKLNGSIAAKRTKLPRSLGPRDTLPKESGVTGTLALSGIGL